MDTDPQAIAAVDPTLAPAPTAAQLLAIALGTAPAPAAGDTLPTPVPVTDDGVSA